MSLNWATKQIQLPTFGHQIRGPIFFGFAQNVLVVKSITSIDPMIEKKFIIPIKIQLLPKLFWAMLEKTVANFWLPLVTNLGDQNILVTYGH